MSVCRSCSKSGWCTTRCDHDHHFELAQFIANMDEREIRKQLRRERWANGKAYLAAEGDEAKREELRQKAAELRQVVQKYKLQRDMELKVQGRNLSKLQVWESSTNLMRTQMKTHVTIDHACTQLQIPTPEFKKYGWNVVNNIFKVLATARKRGRFYHHVCENLENGMLNICQQEKQMLAALMETKEEREIFVKKGDILTEMKQIVKETRELEVKQQEKYNQLQVLLEEWDKSSK